jgi:transposase-like protein
MSGHAELMHHHARASALRSGFAGFRFPPEVITIAVRWYLRHGLSTAMWSNCWPNGASP